MAAYTDFFADKSFNIFDAEDYIEELKKAVKLFRAFDQALDTFLTGHGFAGNLNRVDEKVTFLTDKFKEAGIPVPRNIRKWYTEHKRMERKTAFQICFAFQLDIEGVNDFLRRICLARGFDCHSIEEVVYFYAFKNGLNYGEVTDILSQVQTVKPARMEKENIVYTSLIAREIDAIETVEELVSYLNENVSKFGYNNATAYDAIRTIWESISKKDGIAARERRRLYDPLHKVEARGEPAGNDVEMADNPAGNDAETADNPAENHVEEEADLAENHVEERGEPAENHVEERDDPAENHGENRRKQRKRPDDSIWEIYLQMLGLSGDYRVDFRKDRSLKPILKDNRLLHPLAEDSFPDRDGLNKILLGEHVSYERVRKLLILLVFYKFWAGRALKRNGYEAGYEDADRCLAQIDHHLMDAGYPSLYPGNPYDFIFLVSANSERPLLTFREYMREMFFEKMSMDEL